jgi:hypothetical protein
MRVSTTANPETVAIMIGIVGTFAILAFTFLWAFNTQRPVRRRAHLTGRPAVPYWYSPTGHQDERGIKPL